ncbi:hypothetical protein KUCAC02_003013 [Chaenocephalus aceratus]|uniref:Uncharacterized protein n=1 Tax=Chaenocephalus aceratus TaxID=36190 RepID=A0ACB9WJC3_CHAAC|nr:hypothetical protein KUCAC02_003013 [Chaenocephalus aceratus]
MAVNQHNGCTCFVAKAGDASLAKTHRLINDVATRWNSSYEMVERYLEQKSAVYSALSALKNKDIANLTDQEDFLHKCTALDPRFKTLPHLDRASHLRIYEDLIIPEVLSRAENVETTGASPATTSQATSLPATAEVTSLI